MLTRLPAAADPTGCEEAQNRLYPSPLAPDAEVDKSTSEGLEEDWREYIVPDLRQSFGDALGSGRFPLFTNRSLLRN